MQIMDMQSLPVLCHLTPHEDIYVLYYVMMSCYTALSFLYISVATCKEPTVTGVHTTDKQPQL